MAKGRGQRTEDGGRRTEDGGRREANVQHPTLNVQRPMGKSEVGGSHSLPAVVGRIRPLADRRSRLRRGYGAASRGQMSEVGGRRSEVGEGTCLVISDW